MTGGDLLLAHCGAPLLSLLSRVAGATGGGARGTKGKKELAVAMDKG